MSGAPRLSPGFTLLEIILTLVLFGIVAVVAVSFFTSGLTRSDIAVRQLKTDAGIQLVLENMIADQQARYSGNLNMFSAALGAVGQEQSAYGSGSSYVITDKRFVCPVDKAFVTNTTTDQYLLVTIKPDVASAVGLSYLFSSKSATNRCNVSGSN